MAHHAHQTGLFLHLIDLERVGVGVGDGYLDFDVFAGAHALHRLLGVQLGRRREDRSLDIG